MIERRTFISSLFKGVAAVAAAAASPAAWAARKITSYRYRYLRPPGAVAEEEFIARCIRCNQCAQICPNDCIKYFGLENDLASFGTPYITPREKACILCMKCCNICPSGALQPIERELDQILKNVKMGKARVDEKLCLSYQGLTCGVCYRACPLPDIALSVQRLEQPVVSEACVGCGLCELSCIQMPQAIRVIPNHGGIYG
ncbi:MAG TPA: 4Fe-4S dicluster domain-containing protein [Deltaproteobacteria bacterium]|nr:4Fe-4S dicluster domain-containing protein [Deltaproteobacteria bacterium]